MAQRLADIALFAPSLEDISQLATEAIGALPLEIRHHARNVLIRVEDFPSDEICEELELDTPFDILGLYQGIDLPHQSVSDAEHQPDMVFLFRRPMLDFWCESGESLADIVRNVLIHEIGHHFGLSDEEMERLEDGE